MKVAIVVIGRNEESSLAESLSSCSNFPTCYVDSGSTDNSLELSMKYVSLFCEILSPFSAAKARNKGVEFLKEKYPSIEYVQFIDGDCLLDPDWLDIGLSYLSSNEDVAVVCGARQERFPHESVFNKLCNQEWNPVFGMISSCGGDALFRLSAFDQVSGFDQSLTAGEEPELCFRLREKNWKIVRIDHSMTSHNADIKTFFQYSKRVQRAGYAYMYGFLKHIGSVYNIRPVLRIVFWGVFLPVMMILSKYSLVIFIVYFFQFIRLFLKSEFRGIEIKIYQAFFLSYGKVFEAIGMFRALYSYYVSKKPTFIDYK